MRPLFEVRQRRKAEMQVAEYEARVSKIVESGRLLEYTSGRTNLDYALEREKIWRWFAQSIGARA